MEELPIKIPSKDSKPIRKEGKFTIYLSPDGTHFKAFTVDENSFRDRALNVEEKTDAIQRPTEKLKFVEKNKPEPVPHWTALGYGAPPLGSLLIQAYNSKKLHTHPYYERPIKEQLVIRDGLSPDSYSSIIRLGTRDGSLRWGEAAFNSPEIQHWWNTEGYKWYK